MKIIIEFINENRIIKFRNLLFVFLISLFVSSCDKSNDDMMPLTDGDAPDFSLNSLNGTQVMLSEFNNKVVVLFFFGNTCPSCKAAAPSVQSNLVTPFASRSDYQILGLDQWDGNQASVQSFKTITGVTFPLLLNASPVAALYKTTYDRLLVIDKNGSIAFSGSQSASLDIAAVKQKVEMLLSK